MNKVLLFLVLSTATASIVSAQGILQSEDARFQAQMTLDVEALQELVADDLVYIHSNALVESKEDFIASVASGKIVYARMEAESGRQVRMLRSRVGVVNGVVHVVGQYQGTDFDIRLRYTAVYRKRKGQWLLASWQSTRVPD